MAAGKTSAKCEMIVRSLRLLRDACRRLPLSSDNDLEDGLGASQSRGSQLQYVRASDTLNFKP
jgi:hypothetical protein